MCFATFLTAKGAQKAVKELNGQTRLGASVTIELDRVQPKFELPNRWVGN